LSAGMAERRIGCARRAAAVAAVASILSGCASVIADMPVIGLPEGAPPRPAAQAEYPAVHDRPPRQGDAPLSAEEQRKLEQELIAARESQGKLAEEIARQGQEPVRKRAASRPKGKSTGGAGAQAAGTSRDP
jgi:hypothetical protein